MSKIKPIAFSGNGTGQFGVPSSFDLVWYNDGGASVTVTAILKDETDTEVFRTSQVIASKATVALNHLMADMQWSVEITGSNASVSTLICKLQETTSFSNTYSTNSITHVADGVATTYDLPANAPANNAKELSVDIEGVIPSPTEWSLNGLKTGVIFTSAPAAGLEINLTLMKQE
jgi:hypothetical protein